MKQFKPSDAVPGYEKVLAYAWQKYWEMSLFNKVTLACDSHTQSAFARDKTAYGGGVAPLCGLDLYHISWLSPIISLTNNDHTPWQYDELGWLDVRRTKESWI